MAFRPLLLHKALCAHDASSGQKPTPPAEPRASARTAVSPRAGQAQAFVFHCSNNVRVFGTLSPAKAPCSPAPTWRGNGGAQHLVLRFRNDVQVFGTLSPAIAPRSPSPNWRGNGGAPHLVDAALEYHVACAAFCQRAIAPVHPNPVHLFSRSASRPRQTCLIPSFRDAQVLGEELLLWRRNRSMFVYGVSTPASYGG